MKSKSNSLCYSRPMMYLFNFVFFFIHLFVVFLYGLFVWPVKKIIKFYNFLIQINIALRIQSKIKKVFETEYKNFPCENNLGSNDVRSLLKSFNYFENKKNHPEIAGSINETLYTFDYNYRGIYINITKSFKKRMYIIEMKINDKTLINVERFYNFRNAKYTTLFL